jgi:mevalonate kinase
LDIRLLKSLDLLLEPFAKKEFQHVAVLAFLYLYISLAKSTTTNVTFLLRSAIPIGSGLGSSASISVCLATALLTMGQHIPRPNPTHETSILKIINDWAYLGEKCIHGNPSGVDNTVATFGGGVVFRKERRERRHSNGTFTPSKPAEKIIIK